MQSLAVYDYEAKTSSKLHSNVKLTWWTDDEVQRVDERWERLNAISNDCRRSSEAS